LRLSVKSYKALTTSSKIYKKVSKNTFWLASSTCMLRKCWNCNGWKIMSIPFY